MKVYIAGMYTNDAGPFTGRLFTEIMNDREREVRLSARHLLESYHYVHKQAKVDLLRQDGQKVFMDSGAFSAFTLGSTINLKEYCDYIKRNGDIIERASVLDGIGDPLKTYQNQVLMERTGVAPLPCFHYGEDERYLEHYIANYEYITLGGMVPVSTQQCRIWLDRIWSRYLCDEEGHPKLKVHGFGMTSIPLMRRYPWYSVDSSSWVQIGFRGGIILPEFGTIAVSATSPNRKDEGKHYSTFKAHERERIDAEVEKRGFTVERLATVYVSRWIYNLGYFVEMESEMEDKVLNFKIDQMEIF